MRRIALGVVVGCGLAGTAVGQTPASQSAPQAPLTVTPNPFSMPGTPVGKPLVTPVGTQINKAAPEAGTRVGTGPGGIPGALDPQSPKPAGQQIDLKNVIAPYPNMPKPDPNFWQRLEQRFNAIFEPDAPAIKPPQWTPGLARRNRERAKEKEQMQRRD